MTIHLATARSGAGSPLSRILTRRRPSTAANDNYTGEGDDQLLHAALRHFAEHGLRAAKAARKEAEIAFFAGDRDRYLWWLGICRTLDKRLATELERQTPAR